MGAVVAFPKKMYKEKTVHTTDDLEDYISYFDRNYRRGRKRLKEQGFAENPDQDNILVLKAIRKMAIRMLVVAEKMFAKYKNERAAYCVNMLVNMVRDVSADLRVLEREEKKADYLVDAVLEPMYKMMVKRRSGDAMTLQQKLLALVKPEKRNKLREVLEEFALGEADYLEMVQSSTAEKIRGYLVGDN